MMIIKAKLTNGVVELIYVIAVLRDHVLEVVVVIDIVVTIKQLQIEGELVGGLVGQVAKLVLVVGALLC